MASIFRSLQAMAQNSSVPQPARHCRALLIGMAWSDQVYFHLNFKTLLTIILNSKFYEVMLKVDCFVGYMQQAIGA